MSTSKKKVKDITKIKSLEQVSRMSFKYLGEISNLVDNADGSITYELKTDDKTKKKLFNLSKKYKDITVKDLLFQSKFNKKITLEESMISAMFLRLIKDAFDPSRNNMEIKC